MSRLVDDEVRARAAAGAGAGDDALMAVLCGVFQGRPPAIGRRQRRSRWSRDQLALIPPALVAGALTDALVRRLRPSVGRPVALRVLAFAVPVAYFGLFFGALGLSRGCGGPSRSGRAPSCWRAPPAGFCPGSSCRRRCR